MERKHLIELLAINAENAFALCLIGDPPQFISEYYDRIRTPLLGDLVLELTSRLWPNTDIMNRVGWLEDITLNNRESEIYTIRTLDDRLVTWQNAQFIVIAQEIAK